MNMKGIKTTIVGILAIIGLGYKIYLSGGLSVEDFLILTMAIGFFLSKDADQTHSKDNPPPDLQQHDPIKKYKINDHVLQDSKEWRAIKNNGPGVFNEDDWVCLF